MNPLKFLPGNALLTSFAVPPDLATGHGGQVIEVVTFQLKPGVSVAEFAPIDLVVERDHVAKQPGFVSRESAHGAQGEWLVIVHWQSAQDADASMATFEQAPAAASFMSKIDASTMRMKRYQR
ncbi:antibiotic biosynthesis monooxygenase family protein [Hydrogenophaga sp. ZJX-1]|uniref:antibiotic biosynthesis monooxygenase family protein n=1 Tax=Hydrogenophaga sp. ZJX-1 TaxID=3404778 RepID=UPI003B28B408